MSGDSFDDDFGGFEAAPTIPPQASTQSTTSPELLKPDFDLPDWLLEQSMNLNSNAPNDSLLKLQDELTQTKEQLLDQQTRYLQMQTLHRKEIDDTTNSFNNAAREFQSLLKQGLEQQHSRLAREFKAMLEQQANEFEVKLKAQARDLQARHEAELNAKLETRFAEFQERMIVNYESDLQDLDVKVRKIVSATVKEENLAERTRLKQSFESMEKGVKSETEKYVQTFFKNQSEIFKVS
jgi:hypothetical protein